MTKFAPTMRQRVADIGDPDFVGTIITVGEQVSEVKWDEYERGASQFVGNEYLMPAMESKP